jgi:hypothetical protein
MSDPKLGVRVLSVLLRRSHDNEIIDLFELGSECGAELALVLRTLDALDAAGLVDARRLRLTLSGLAVASAFAARARKARLRRAPARAYAA